MNTYRSGSAEETLTTGKKIAQFLGPGAVVALEGRLGAGKTTLTKGIALGLGVEETITSPTFTLISEYEGAIPFYHMDLYRLNSSEEFELLGAEDLLYGNGVTVVEWSEKARDIFPDDAIYVSIHIEPDGSRIIQVEGLAL